MKKFIALMLVLAMALSACTTLSFASKGYNGTIPESQVKYNTYIAFGDSMSRGTGVVSSSLSMTKRNAYTNDYNGTGRAAAAYTYLLSQAVGCDAPNRYENDYGPNYAFYYPICCNGMTLASAMDLLGMKENKPVSATYTNLASITNLRDISIDLSNGGNVLPLWMGNYYNAVYKMFGGEYSITKEFLVNQNRTYTEVHDVKSIIYQAAYSRPGKTLITTNLGLGDVLLEPVIKLLCKSNSDLSIKDVADEMAKAFITWAQDYPRFVKELHNLNENADIVLVGYYNPLEGLKISDDSLLEIGNIFKPYVMMMNQVLKELAAEYPSWCVYADASNAECLIDEKNMSIENWHGADVTDATHLSPNAHEYIARQVINALEDKRFGKVVTPFNQYDITVDLGRSEFIGQNIKVLVNGLPVLGTMDGTVLHINYNNPYATTLNVTIENGHYDSSNGYSDVNFTYILTYENNRYNACKIYGTNDLDTTKEILKEDVIDTVNFVTKAAAEVSEEVKEAVQAAVRNAVKDTVDKAQDAFEDVPYWEERVAGAIDYSRKDVAKNVVDGAKNVITNLLEFDYFGAAEAAYDARQNVSEAVERAVERNTWAVQGLAKKVNEGWKNFLTPGWGRN